MFGRFLPTPQPFFFFQAVKKDQNLPCQTSKMERFVEIMAGSLPEKLCGLEKLKIKLKYCKLCIPKVTFLNEISTFIVFALFFLYFFIFTFIYVARYIRLYVTLFPAINH